MEEKNDLKVRLGDPIQLQFVPLDGRERLTAKIIGYSPNKSIIISAPSINGKMPMLKEHQPFVVRMLQDNDVYGFESSVLKAYSVPYPHVHLSHPKDIESITVRSSRRVGTETIVSVTTAAAPDQALSITMLNSSATGALLQTIEALGELDDELNIAIKLEIADIKKFIRVKAIIRNISTTDDAPQQNLYGVQFLNLSDDQKLLISAYVYEQIVIHMQDR